jgi:putative tricarboxylic transport membrane protein
MPLVFTLCVIGPYALTQRPFEIVVMVAFGLAGFVLRHMNYPMPPLVLGIILGTLLDKSLRRGLILSDGDLTPFFTRPVSAGFAILICLSIALGVQPVRRAALGAVNRLVHRQSGT